MEPRVSAGVEFPRQTRFILPKAHEWRPYPIFTHLRLKDIQEYYVHQKARSEKRSQAVLYHRIFLRIPLALTEVIKWS